MKRAFALLGLAMAAIAFAFGGWRGIAGLGCGVLGTGVSVYGWWPTIRLLGRAAEQADDEASRGATKRIGTAYVLLLFLIKIPVFLALGFVARRVGGQAVPWFLAGVGLVYFALIGWGVDKTARSA